MQQGYKSGCDSLSCWPDKERKNEVALGEIDMVDVEMEIEVGCSFFKNFHQEWN